MWKPFAAFQPIKEHFNRKLWFCMGLLMCCSANYAFDNKSFAQTQAMPQFLETFGDYNEKTGKYKLEATYLALFNSLNFVGFAIGLWIGTTLQAKYGRKMVVGIMMSIPVVAVTILITSKERWQLFAGRQLFYIFAGMDLGVIPVYQAELAPHQVRGFMAGSYQLSYAIGALVMNFITRGTVDLKGNAAWQVAYGCSYVLPVIVWSCLYWIPESPRWLISKGRISEAKEILRTIRADPTEESLDDEIAATLVVLNHSKSVAKWRDMLKGTHVRRALISICAITFNQLTGNQFASKYGAIFVGRVGAVNPQDMGIVNGMASLLSTVLAMIFTDKLGRRTIWMTGAVIQTSALLTMGGLSTRTPSGRAEGVAISSMLPIYNLGFGFGSSSVQHVINSETPHQSLRDKTAALVGFLNSFWGFVVSFTLPYLMDTAGLEGKVGFIFGFFGVFSIFWAYFFLPEMSHRTLEEINLLFYDHIGARESVRWKAPPDYLERIDMFTADGKALEGRGADADPEYDTQDKLDADLAEEKLATEHLEKAKDDVGRT